MDAFEQLVGEILWMEGFWVRPSYKVKLTKAEKVRIGRHSSPRWELDIVAYRARDNTLYVVECKSYLDSVGVRSAALEERDHAGAKRYKLFHESKLRKVVFERLCADLVDAGACKASPKVRLALACGKIKSEKDRERLHLYFDRKGWDLWDEDWLRNRIRDMAKGSYENQVSSVVAKLMLREKVKA